MHIVADENIPALELFARHGHITKVAGRAINATHLQHADVLLVRSVTSVNERLLGKSPVRFVGTCTIGVDHLDVDFLHHHNIVWHNAPGCNARAVVEYVLSVLQVLAQRTDSELASRCYGIVGVGQVGQRLAQVLRGLGFEVLLCDPPRQHGQATDTGLQPSIAAGDYVELATIIERCDVVSLHTPLLKDGLWPTYHLFAEEQLRALRPGAWLINAARGAVVDNQALLGVLKARCDLAVVLDVWEPEPELNPELAGLCQLATPHIAGYSLDGKIRGTEMIYRAFCQHFSLPIQRELDYPEPLLKSIEFGAHISVEEMLRIVCLTVYDPRRDDAALRMTFSSDVSERARKFDQLRKNYPVRRELAGVRVRLSSRSQPLMAAVQVLGMLAV